MSSLPLAAAAPAPPERRWPLRLRRALRWLYALLLLAWSLLLIGWLVLNWAILPRLDDFRPRIEAAAARALGLPVKIGTIEVSTSGWIPVFDFRDVTVSDRAGNAALALAHVRAALAPRSLLALAPRFSQVYLEGVEFEARRARDGRLSLAGFELSAAGAGGAPPALLDWLFVQPEVVVRQGALRWVDEQREAPPLALGAVDFVLRNGLRSHDLRLDATPPADWGSRFALRGRFVQPLWARPADWKRWSGTAYAELPRVDASLLRRHVELPLELRSGHGALRAWVEFVDGAPRVATLDAALADVRLRFGSAAAPLAPLALRTLGGRFDAARDERGVRLTAEGLSFETDDGTVWPAGRIALQWQQRDAEGAPVTGGRVGADRLDLATMSRLAARLPLPSKLREALVSLAPAGVVADLVASWDGDFEAPAHYALRARVAGLALAAAAGTPPAGPRPRVVWGRPGVAGASFDVDANERGGKARLQIVDGALEFPGLFAEPRIGLDRLGARVEWRVDPDGALTVQLRDLRAENADLAGRAELVWRSGSGDPGRIELGGRIDRAQAARLARYLPLELSDDVRSYLARAVQGGRIENAAFEAKGELRDFPYADSRHPGRFRIAGSVRDATFAYVPPAPPGAPSHRPWPALTGVTGELEFAGAAMHVRNARAASGAFALEAIHGTIADLEHAPLLSIGGAGRGPAAELLRFVAATPLAEWTGGALAQASAAGPATLALELALPLTDLDRARVRGSVGLAGSSFRLRPELPSFDDARGRVAFTERGFDVTLDGARVLGGPASLQGGTQPDGTLRFAGQGSVAVEGLRALPEAAPWAPLVERLRGQARYRMQLGIEHGSVRLELTSPLTGLAIDLPAPLGKRADESWPLRLTSAPTADAMRETLAVELGTALKARWERDVGGPTPRLLRGAIAVGEEPVLPPAGVVASAYAVRFDADAWLDAIAALPAVAAGARPAAGAPTADAAPGYLPRQLALRADTLVYDGRPFTRAHAVLAFEPGSAERAWRVRVDADQASGTVELRHPPGGGRIVDAHFARLTLPAPPAEAPAASRPASAPAAGEPPAPAELPELHLQIDEFAWRGMALGKVEIAGAPRPGGAGWTLERLAATLPQAVLAASGRYTPQRRSELDFTFDVKDGGALVERLGAGKVLEGGGGRIDGRLAWNGTPFSPDLRSLEGHLAIALGKGTLTNAEPGAARLLGVFSLQALPRRLLLDFRDLFRHGLAFDRFDGELDLRHGVASTRKLTLRGVQATMLMEGSFDLVDETQDLTVVAIPEVDAGAVSLAYAAINPALGLGSFIAQWLLRRPLMAANTREYRVTGPWEDPKIERVERSPAAAGASAPR